MTFFLIILMPYFLMLIIFSSKKTTELLKNLKRAVVLFQVFLILNLFILKTLFNIDFTFVNHNLNPDFLSLKAIVFSNLFALIIGALSKFMTEHFSLIIRKEVDDE